MSIIHMENEEFAILDEQKFYGKIYKNLKIRPELFEIHSKFMPDSQFEAIQRRGNSENSKSRKRRRPDSEYPEDITEIQNLSVKIQKCGFEIGFFKKLDNPPDNNKKPRLAAEDVLKVQESLKMSLATSSEQILEIGEQKTLEELMCNGLISNWCRNESDGVKMVENQAGTKFYIPPKATFHIGNVTDIHNYATFHDQKFDLIIADPPWFCKSVKRKKTYEMNEEVIDSLDIPSLTSSEGVVGFWITNRVGIKEELIKRLTNWEMEVIGEWKWLKVTTQGDPLYDFTNSSHKVPFETIIFATFSKNLLSKCSKFTNFPRKFVFASVPMAVHSHKPPLYELLEHFGVGFENPLELFARSLLPNTHSVGFEPILLNSEKVLI